MTERDWAQWHEPYDDPSSSLSRRLRTVQQHLGDAIDRAPAGVVRVISICAGQGHDLLGVLPTHPRRDDVRARLVELDARNVEMAQQAVVAGGLGAQVEVTCHDASVTSSFEGAVPADVVLACGIFGNISDEDIEHTVASLPSLCAPRATVLWTRHRNPPDRTPDIRRWFAHAGFDEVAFDAPDDVVYGVGVHRLAVPPTTFVAGRRLFRFIGYDELLRES